MNNKEYEINLMYYVIGPKYKKVNWSTAIFDKI